MKKAIVWDWNGTLLNDVDLVLELTNKMLDKRNANQLTLEQYKNCFSFPIEDYYRRIGFVFSTKEEFLKIVQEFNCAYEKQMEQCPLYCNEIEVLQYFREQGYVQYIVSGLNQRDLMKAVKGKKIDDFFRKIIGSKEMDATDKYANIVALIQKENLCNTSIAIIGDTLSDYYLAEKIRCRSVLLSQGHQSKQKLCKVDGVRVVDDFVALIELDSMGKLYE